MPAYTPNENDSDDGTGPPMLGIIDLPGRLLFHIIVPVRHVFCPRSRSFSSLSEANGCGPHAKETRVSVGRGTEVATYFE